MTLRTLPLLIIILILSACNNSDSSQKLIAKFEKAIDYGDSYTAIFYAHEILAKEQKNDTITLKLLNLYNITKNHTSSVNLANEILPRLKNREKVEVLNIKARNLSALGQVEKAIETYDELHKIDTKNSIQYLYEIGTLYFKIRKIQKGIAAMQQIVDNPESRTLLTTIQSDWGRDKVPYYLAALNYVGYIYIETENFNKADKIYKKIKSTNVPFKLANGNIKLLEQRKTKANQQ